MRLRACPSGPAGAVAAAERAGEPQLARVLRAFTPILESLANDDADAAASAVSQLGFELRVMQSRLGADAKPTI